MPASGFVPRRRPYPGDYPFPIGRERSDTVTSADGWRSRAGHHPGRRQCPTRQVEGSILAHIPLRDGPAHPRRDPCCSKPQATKPRGIAPGHGQASQHQDYPQNPKEDHSQPGVCSVWCSVPMVWFWLPRRFPPYDRRFHPRSRGPRLNKYSVSSLSARTRPLTLPSPPSVGERVG
jgi:hypothetical protein